MSACPSVMCLHNWYVVPADAKEGVRSTEAGVTGGCESPCECRESERRSFARTSVFCCWDTSPALWRNFSDYIPQSVIIVFIDNTASCLGETEVMAVNGQTLCSIKVSFCHPLTMWGDENFMSLSSFLENKNTCWAIPTELSGIKQGKCGWKCFINYKEPHV